MPSMSPSVYGYYNGSPRPNSQLRIRKARVPSARNHLEARLRHSSLNPSQVGSRRASASVRQAQKVQEEQEEISPWHYVNLFRANVLWPCLRFLLDVFRYAMNHFMKPIFGTALALFVIIFALKLSSGLLQTTIESAIAPVCSIPGSSYLLPFCSTIPMQNHNANFEELVNVQNSFEDVVEASHKAASLPLEMRDGASAIRDLRSLVKYSQLPSRSQLEVEFGAFIETATEASEQLTKYNVKIGATLDRVIVTNGWTLQNLEGLAEKEASTGSVPRLLSNLNPFSVFLPTPSSLEELIYEGYIWHLAQVKEDIIKLIHVAHTLLALLNSLEEQLDIIGDIAIRDNVIVSRNRDELLSLLWSKLGGNRASKKGYNESLTLIKKVIKYKKLALDHVTTTLLKLQEIAAGLENLREDVAAPEIVGFRSGVPLQYHIGVISKSLDAFKEMRGERMGLERDAVRRGMGKLATEDGPGNKRLPAGGREIPTLYAKSVQK